MKRVIAIPTYHKIYVCYKLGMVKGQRFNNEFGGLFSKRTNVFNSIEKCLEFFDMNKVGEGYSILFHKDFLGSYMDFHNIGYESDVRYSECGEWITGYVMDTSWKN